jgi:hypothetical protein
MTKDKDHWNAQAPLQQPNALVCILNEKGLFQVTWKKKDIIRMNISISQVNNNEQECYQLTQMWVQNIFGILHSDESIQLCKPKRRCWFSSFDQNLKKIYCKMHAQVPWILLPPHVLFHAKRQKKKKRPAEASIKAYNVDYIFVCNVQHGIVVQLVTFLIKHE